MLKKAIIKVLRHITTYKVLKTQHRAINSKIKRLTKQGQYKTYPLKEVKPVICNYPFFKKNDIKWFNYFYSVYGKPDPGVIPLSSYYTVIEPCLNDRLLINTVKDKNYYNLFLKHIKTPDVVLRRINGHFYDGNYNHIDLTDDILASEFESYDKIIIKPALFSGSGRRIFKFEKRGHHFSSEDQKLTSSFLEQYGNELVIQRFVKQHSFFKKFNPDSNNTIRVLTYRSVSSDKVHILHTLLRIGAKGSFLDHDNKGGVSIAVNDNSHLSDTAFNIVGDRIEIFNDTKFSEVGEVPFIDGFHNAALYVASKVYHGRLLAIDFTINEDGEPLLIEVNCWGNGISQYQMSNGSVFKKYTEEVLDYCQKKRFHDMIIFPVSYS